jgi:hypothetical protein
VVAANLQIGECKSFISVAPRITILAKAEQISIPPRPEGRGYCPKGALQERIDLLLILAKIQMLVWGWLSAFSALQIVSMSELLSMFELFSMFEIVLLFEIATVFRPWLGNLNCWL